MHLMAGVIQHPASERNDCAGFLRDRHKVRCRQQAAPGMLPEDLCLHAQNPAAVQINFRCVMQPQLIAFKGGHQFADQGHALGHFPRNLLGVEVILVAAHFLGAVQRHVGLPEQAVGVETELAVTADANAHRNVQCIAGQVIRRQQRVADVGGHRRRLGRVTDVQLQDREFIATQTRHHVAFADTGLDAPGDLLQQQIANRVAQRVIDPLEVVQIQVKHRKRHRAASRSGKRVVQAFDQCGAIGQARQAIGAGEQGQFVLGLATFSDVEDDAFDFQQTAVLIAYRDVAVLHPAPGALAGAHAEFDGRARRMPIQYPGHCRVDAGLIIRVNQDLRPVGRTHQVGGDMAVAGDVVRDVHQRE